MDSWVLWVVLAAALAAGEIRTGGFSLAPFAVGAAVAALVSAAGAGLVLAAPVFVLAALIVLVLLRPVATRRRRLPRPIRTGGAALVGKRAVVLERIANHEGLGSVTIEGEVWTARSYEEDHEIDVGERVHVVEIKGATALVME